MKPKLVSLILLSLFLLCDGVIAQKRTPDVPYVENGHKRHVLDIYAPEKPSKKSLPVMFWIHGGGWQVGDKSDVALKPKALTDRGFVFVSTNYRLLPEIAMEELIGDVAKSLGWVHENIAKHGGDPSWIRRHACFRRGGMRIGRQTRHCHPRGPIRQAGKNATTR
ncbi:MAG: carboxylesterase family protein, partial [Planctomycetales bacterium]